MPASPPTVLAAVHPDTDTEELARLAAEFPGHRIWREITEDRTQYVARSTSLRARPHTLITDSLTELRAELSAAGHPQAAASPAPDPGSGPPPPGARTASPAH